MFCKECGKEIANDSKFCSHCGANQISGNSSTVIAEKTENEEPVISEKQINKLKSTFGINISKKTIGYYLIWIVAHFIILLVNGDFEYDEDFWPITDLDIYYYDFSEFLIYTIVPLLFLFAINLFKNDEKEKIKQSKYDLSFKRDFGYLTWGIIILGIYIAYWAINEDFFYYELGIANKSGTWAIASMIIRIIITVKVVGYAGKLNRNKTGWGFLGFFIPLLSLIIVSFQYKLKDMNIN